MGKIKMEVGGDGVAVITIHNPPLNLLTVDIVYSLIDKFEEALRRDDVKAIVLAGSNGKFSGGVDVSTFGEGRKRWNSNIRYVSIDVLTDTFEAAKKPSVAAIDSFALGGALEIAMACHARISTSTAQLGLTELQYGLIPGFGGTQRLPCLVGLSKALEMMLMSKPIKAVEAHALGLVDAIAPPDELVMKARQWALEILESRRPWVASIYRNDKLVPFNEAREVLNFARAQVQKQSPKLQHQLLCIDAIEEGIVSGPRAGLLKEAELFVKVLGSDTSKSLVNIFFARRLATKVPGITNLGLVPRRINKVAIVGGGLMGSGIGTVLILSGYPVILKEINQKSLEAGIGRIRANLENDFQRGKITDEKFHRALSLLKGVLVYESFKGVDLVVEAIVENVSLKQQVFTDLEKYCPSHCILASNTSTIDLNLIGEKAKSHDRIVGAHFFSPANVMPLLEIVRTHKTSPQVIVDLLDLSKKIHKTPIVVRSCTGFAVSRLLFPYAQSAFLLVHHGLDVYQIDRAVSSFGMPMGPFRMIDLVGLWVAAATGAQFLESFPERCFRSPLIPVMLEDNRVGEATCKGFYLYDEKRKPSPDPFINKYVEKSRSIMGLTTDIQIKNLPDADIVEMIFFPVVNEACHILADGIVDKASDLDIASVLSMGFPSYRGGIMFWADSVGSKFIYSKLVTWAETHGDFFKPCAYLAERAARGTSLRAPIDKVGSRL